MPDGGRTLVETGEYSAQLDALADKYSIEVLEAALLGLLWGIATNPERYEKVTGRIYQAKSRSFAAQQPRFRVLFSIEDENRVFLMWIEEIGSTDDITGK
ncbi:MAG TPA: hypothetical protein VGR73_10080 [Bryobacteraceae bacterium]|nr:hypothetical protein [Bryobacteraceae bacterium]